MLELRPTCEHCNKALPPNSLEARVCTYECTFCATCVGSILSNNICPNCGGGFVPRPIRPAINWKDDNYLGKSRQAPKSNIGRWIWKPMQNLWRQSAACCGKPITHWE